MKILNDCLIEKCWDCEFCYEQEKPDYPVYKIMCEKLDTEIKKPFNTIDKDCPLADVEVIADIKHWVEYGRGKPIVWINVDIDEDETDNIDHIIIVRKHSKGGE